MTRYVALVDHADGAYGVVFPDAPGCTAQAASFDEAVADAGDALAEWVDDLVAEGLDVPRPRRVEELLANDDVRQALADGSVLVMVPCLARDARAVRANISMEAGLLADIDAEAKRRGLTRSAFLTSAARQAIKAG